MESDYRQCYGQSFLLSPVSFSEQLRHDGELRTILIVTVPYSIGSFSGRGFPSFRLYRPTITLESRHMLQYFEFMHSTTEVATLQAVMSLSLLASPVAS